ncbi:hypothetical protein D9V29_01315 [Mycetocola manganoxydans]|uniref:Uncharacterized protein n=1 Tax=Mycetocola manganoxydans TaxID=699879 RepID=A0A3L7A082_9MICO|nr:hypothetical protein [Mycetocola manganoxydans]RLP73365.1 hypothetical protein D9V29_01315 [Mycetocola manganoxydans]GHD42126.1 hypothetical protein GCM10008097_07680 [Mycetocola manganoxydans]
MPDLSNVTTPVEWVVTHSAAKEPIAIVRRLRLGAERELYFRAVTWNADPAKRELVGYWGSAEEAVQNVYGLFERSLPPQFLMTGGGTARQPQPLTKPKPPPASARPQPNVPTHQVPQRAARPPAAQNPGHRVPDRRMPARQLVGAGR